MKASTAFAGYLRHEEKPRKTKGQLEDFAASTERSRCPCGPTFLFHYEQNGQVPGDLGHGSSSATMDTALSFPGPQVPLQFEQTSDIPAPRSSVVSGWQCEILNHTALGLTSAFTSYVTLAN